jgi:small conductance mechanosensitive channel
MISITEEFYIFYRFVVMGILYGIFYWLITTVLNRIRFPDSLTLQRLIVFIKRFFQVVLLLLFIVNTLYIFHIDVQNIIASLGLLTFSLGVALKDLISNLISGFSLLFYKPFRVNSIIDLDGLEGKVLDIDIRYTSILKGDQVIYKVPNKYILDKTIKVIKY